MCRLELHLTRAHHANPNAKRQNMTMMATPTLSDSVPPFSPAASKMPTATCTEGRHPFISAGKRVAGDLPLHTHAKKMMTEEWV